MVEGVALYTLFLAIGVALVCLVTLHLLNLSSSAKLLISATGAVAGIVAAVLTLIAPIDWE